MESSPCSLLAWLEELRLDVDRAESAKEVYERELRGLVLPSFSQYAVREVTVGCVERYLKMQWAKS